MDIDWKEVEELMKKNEWMLISDALEELYGPYDEVIDYID